LAESFSYNLQTLSRGDDRKKKALSKRLSQQPHESNINAKKSSEESCREREEKLENMGNWSIVLELFKNG